ncbi:MAG: class IV adenylate cyclase [Patescibacteria group bacterium]
MKEIEILVRVHDDKKTTLEKLSRYRFCGMTKILDIYYHDPKSPELHPDDSGALKRCFRIRQKNNESYLTYKIDHFNANGVWVYSDEHETRTSSFAETQTIIELLGFKELVRVENERHTFTSDHYEITVDDIKELGLFMEVESLKPPADVDVAETKQHIWEFMMGMGIKTSEESSIGKPELVFKQRLMRKDL